jgi:hypothetical protein
MLAVAPLVLFLASAQEPAPQAASIPSGTALDALIARLPPVGSEGKLDPQTNEWIPYADVELMQRCVDAHVLTDEQWLRPSRGPVSCGGARDGPGICHSLSRCASPSG